MSPVTQYNTEPVYLHVALSSIFRLSLFCLYKHQVSWAKTVFFWENLLLHTEHSNLRSTLSLTHAFDMICLSRLAELENPWPQVRHM